MEQFLINLAVGLLGIIFYNVIAFREHLKKKELITSRVFWQSYKSESAPIWIWSLIVILLVNLMVTIAPEVAPSLTTLTGWDVGTNPASYLTLAFMVSAVTSDKKK